MNITPLTPPHEPSIYYSPEPDALHPCIGWYFETPMGYYRGSFDTAKEAALAASEE